MAFNLAITSISTVLYLFYKKHFKYLIITGLALTTGSSMLSAGQMAILIAALPVMLSCFYFSYRLSIYVSVAMFLFGFWAFGAASPEYIVTFALNALILSLLSVRFENAFKHVSESEKRESSLLNKITEVLNIVRASSGVVSALSFRMKESSLASKDSIYAVASDAEELSASIEEITANSDVIKQVAVTVSKK